MTTTHAVFSDLYDLKEELGKYENFNVNFCKSVANMLRIFFCFDNHGEYLWIITNSLFYISFYVQSIFLHTKIRYPVTNIDNKQFYSF